jgi:plastocyanin
MTRVSRRGAAVALWAAAVAAAAAAATAGVLADKAKPVTHTVTIDATSYTPARLAVHVGDTVVWVNKDLIPHTATAKGGGFDSKVMEAGASFRFTVKAKGATDYTCLFHPTMTGRLEAE